MCTGGDACGSAHNTGWLTRGPGPAVQYPWQQDHGTQAQDHSHACPSAGAAPLADPPSRRAHQQGAAAVGGVDMVKYCLVPTP